ncbi:MAG: hypothetical protein ACRDTR_13685 [Rubrobacter sp.]
MVVEVVQPSPRGRQRLAVLLDPDQAVTPAIVYEHDLVPHFALIRKGDPEHARQLESMELFSQILPYFELHRLVARLSRLHAASQRTMKRLAFCES